MSIIRLENLLKSDTDGPLGSVVRTARSMDELTTRLKKVLPEDLADHLLAASLREDGELVLVASSSAWAAKYRYQAAEFMECARQQGVTVERCRVTVSRHL